MDALVMDFGTRGQIFARPMSQVMACCFQTQGATPPRLALGGHSCHSLTMYYEIAFNHYHTWCYVYLYPCQGAGMTSTAGDACWGGVCVSTADTTREHRPCHHSDVVSLTCPINLHGIPIRTHRLHFCVSSLSVRQTPFFLGGGGLKFAEMRRLDSWKWQWLPCVLMLCCICT